LPPVAREFRAAVPDGEVAGLYRLPWRGPGEFYARLIVDDLEGVSGAAGVLGTPAPTVLDIGCGGGLLGEELWQHAIAALAGDYIGIEPDVATESSAVFSRVIHGTFEKAPLERSSVDLAYAAMVIEHVPGPEEFFTKLATVLRPGGVFWAFTVDRRHYFSWASQLLGAVRIKDRYLDRVRGHKGSSAFRYDNFPVYYRCNSPAAFRRVAGDAFSVQTWSLHRVGQLDGYVPYRLRRLSRMADRLVMRAQLPGSVLVARMVRR
jgi:SAM-dependent methyltransferase